MIDLTRITLREWYEQHFLLLYHSAARPGTIEAYRDTLNQWSKATDDPPVGEIDAYTLARFRKNCTCRDSTIAKHSRHLNHLFAKLGPPGPRNRDALNILPQIQWCKPPSYDRENKRIPTDNDLATFVTKAPPDLALFAVVAATTGTRNDAIRAITPDAVDHAAQIIRFPAHTDKRRRERLKPIPAITLKWLARYASLMPKWKQTPSNFARRWNRHARQVGVPTLRPHGLKRWWGASLIRANVSPWAIRYALDHAQRDVTGINYLQPFDELAAVIDRIPLSDAFVARLRHETQATLPF
jgi:integrase